jgi:hypothetical protein
VNVQADQQFLLFFWTGFGPKFRLDSTAVKKGFGAKFSAASTKNSRLLLTLELIFGGLYDRFQLVLACLNVWMFEASPRTFKVAKL